MVSTMPSIRSLVMSLGSSCRHIVEIAFFHNLVIIEKGQCDERTNFTQLIEHELASLTRTTYPCFLLRAGNRADFRAIRSSELRSIFPKLLYLS